MEVKLEKITVAKAHQYLNRNTSNRKLREGVVLKVQNAIHYFMRGKKLMVIKATSDEAYPLPKQKPGTFKSKAV